ncbi:MAG: hypothetical protein JWO77_3810 [Ilumatobacteraceae bacterium]|nr:hypothetical protein [Ilumatobacteraceae bacterium]
MAELDVSPAFEAALRTELARLGESAPVPDDAHLDALEGRADDRPSPGPRDRRSLALVAAIVLVIAGLAASIGAAILRSDDGVDRTRLGGGRGTTTTTAAVPVGPILPARSLTTSFEGRAPEGPDGAILTNGVTDAETLAEVWADAGRPTSSLPTVDFATEVVVEVTMDDVACASPELEFRKGPAAVRAAAVEPASCSDPSAVAGPRTYFYALRWSDTGRPFQLEVADPSDPDAFGSIAIG